MPKTITGSVGRGGKNYPPSDVMTIQYLLNCVPATQGGPAKELAVDGAAGPKTIAAIEGFQRKLGGFADGRVDPGGATLRALQARDLHPNEALASDAAKGGVGAQAKSGHAGPDPFAKQGGFGSPAGKDAFGNKTGQPPAKTGVDPFGNKMAQPPAKTGVDPFGNKTVQSPGSDPNGSKNFGAPAKTGGGMIN